MITLPLSPSASSSLGVSSYDSIVHITLSSAFCFDNTLLPLLLALPLPPLSISMKYEVATETVGCPRGRPIKTQPNKPRLRQDLYKTNTRSDSSTWRLSLHLVPPCLDLVSCLTWSRSSYCNARCCVCWDPMNIDTMFNQVVYLSMCSWSCMLSVTSRCFGQVDAFNSKRGYLCSIVGSTISMPWPVTEGRVVIDSCCY